MPRPNICKVNVVRLCFSFFTFVIKNLVSQKLLSIQLKFVMRILSTLDIFPENDEYHLDITS